MGDKPVLISSQDATAIKASHGVPSGYIAADVPGDEPSADMNAPENSPTEIARRASEASKRKSTNIT